MMCLPQGLPSAALGVFARRTLASKSPAFVGASFGTAPLDKLGISASLREAVPSRVREVKVLRQILFPLVLGEVHAAEQGLEARVIAEAIPARLYFHVPQ